MDGALPGQKVEAKITKKKKRFAEAKCMKVLQKSPLEIETPWQEVPGAPWAKLPIEKQGEFKKKQVFELFQKFANLNLEPIFDEFIESPEIWNYRNKMEFSFGYSNEDFTIDESAPVPEGKNPKKIWNHSGFALGSKKRGQFWLVENLEKASGIFDEEFENFLPTIREFCEKTSLQPWNPKTNSGFFRQLMVRKSFSENKFLINLTTASPTAGGNFDIKKFVELLTTEFGEKIGGIYHTISDAVSDGANAYSKRKMVHGDPTLSEKINNLEFTISIDSFFQTNIFSAEKLYNKAVEYLMQNRKESSKKEKILDLFCGTGTIAQIMAKQLPKAEIIGVEIIESAVEDANKNALLNKIPNVKFICANVTKFLKEYAWDDSIQSIILDPPRAGITPKSLQKILDFAPKQIVYISCNPATLARDTEILSEKYNLEKISIVDQFPHTSHVECVGRFVRK